MLGTGLARWAARLRPVRLRQLRENERAGATCIFPAHDLGIAVGSAAGIAAHHHVDNRVMFSAGVAALRLGLMGEGVKIAFGLPLSVTGKSPFFDRK